jgi:hypothetical protein
MMAINSVLGPIKMKKLVAVEGNDEVRLINALSKSMNLNDIEVRPLLGVSDFPTKLKALVSTPGLSNVVSLGIIRDADEDSSAAFTSVCYALNKVGLSVPTNQLELIKNSDDGPSVAVIIVPLGAGRGMLEDVCMQSVVDDPAIECLNNYFICLEKKLSVFPKNLSKAKVHAFLSSREESDLRLGEAAEKGYWPWSNQAFDCFKALLSSL